MKIIDSLFKLLGFYEVIRIDGINSFDELRPEHLPSMINAYFSDGNQDFSALALSEFLTADLSDPDMIELQNDLNSNAFLYQEGESIPVVNKEYLMGLVGNLSRQ